MTYILSAIAAISIIGIAITCYAMVKAKQEIDYIFGEDDEK